MKNILFTGGGTLGHIYPMVSVVKELRDKNYKLYFIGTTKGLERDYLEKAKLFDKEYYLDSEGLKRKSFSLGNLRAVYKHFRNIRKSKKLLQENKIDLVVGMGGFISACVVRAALGLKLKTMIHEQNSVYGLANRIYHKKVDRVLLTYAIDSGDNIRVVGNPRMSEVYEKYKGSSNNNLGNYLLVVGGSRGAEKINELVIGLKDQFLHNKINVILITGKKYYNENLEKIKEIDCPEFKVLDFSNNLPKLLIEAKLVVSRCGATTLAEIMALRKVSLLIPSPNVTNNHQEKNANEIVKMGAGVMIKEADLNKANLFDNIFRLYFDKEIRSRIVNNIVFNTSVDAKDKFVFEVENLLK